MGNGFFRGSDLTVLKTPTTITPKCGACGLYKTCTSPKMPPSGGGRKKILVVAEAPGEEEDRQGVQLVGNSGQEVMKHFRKVGVDMRRDCTLTNALICRPPGNDIKDDRMVEYCRPNLLRTVEDLKPEVIILLGATAVQSLLGHVWKEDVGGISRWVGWNIPDQKYNAWICPTYHPSFLLRSKDVVLDNLFTDHLRCAVGHKRRPWEVVPDYEKDVEVILDSDKAARILKKMNKAGTTVAFDYEANALKPETEKSFLVTCSVCWEGERTIAYPWHGAARQATVDILTNPEVGKIASNLKYEDRWTKNKLGVRVRGWRWDTTLAAHALDNRGSISSIKFQAFVRLGAPQYDHHVKPYLKTSGGNQINRIGEISLEKLLLYNGLDSLLEYKVAMLQMKEMGVEI